MSHQRLAARLRPIVLLACASLAHAQDRTQLVENVPGPTLEAAVTSGLVRALEQVKGLRIDSALGLQKKHAAETLEITQGMERWFARATADAVSHGSVLQQTAGLIRSYEIVKQEQDPTTREWKVSLSVTIPVYDPKNPRPGARRTLAIVGFRAPAHPFELAGVQVPALDMNRKLVDQSEIQFLQSQKFLVLNRDFELELAGETARLASGGMAFDEQLKLGNRMGADYIVVGNLEEFSWEEQPFEVAVTGYRSTRLAAAYDVSFKVIDVATSQTVSAGNLRRLFDDRELKNLPPEDQQQNLRIADFLVQKAAAELVDRVLGDLYPIKVAGIDGNEVILAAGGARVRVGDRFAVLVVGESFVDPDTGESLGASEQRVATIAIVSVQERQARAVVTDGKLAAIEKGSLCRRLGPGEG